MRKELLKKLMISSTVMSLFFTAIFCVINGYNSIRTEVIYLKTIISKIEDLYNEQERAKNDYKKIFIDDYRNRIAHIDSYLKLSNKKITTNLLKELAGVEDVANIYIVDNNGIIVKSSDVNSLGLNFYSMEGGKNFISLIEGKKREYFCEFNSKSVTTQKNMVYLMERVDKNKLIQIEIEPNIYENYIEDSWISSYLKSILTRENRKIFLLDNNTERLIIKSQNNDRKLESPELLKQLKKRSREVRFIKIEGQYYILVEKEISDNLILGNMTTFSLLLENNLRQGIIFFIVVSAFTTVMMIINYRTLDRLVVKDIENLNENIKLFLEGKEVDFSKGRTEEISNLTNLLNLLTEDIKCSKEQLKLMVNILGKNFTGYEYYSKYNRMYIIDNYEKITGYKKSELENIIKSIFEKNRNKNSIVSEKIIGKNGKVLEVKRYVTRDSIFGIVEDITDKEQEKEKIYTDELTGLYNRRKMMKFFKENLNSKNNGEKVVILFDLDNFKKINDNISHLEGDSVLKKFAEILKEVFRKEDILVRFGGDEFIVIIPNRIPSKCLEQKIRNIITKLNQLTKNYKERFNFSVSIGATYCNGKECTYTEILEKVDKAMYQVKKNGKNNYFIIS